MTSVEAPYGRMLTAMATAFADDGSVDLEGTAAIAAHLVDHGNDGVVVSGTTGESPTTTTEEDGLILQAVKDAVGDRATIIAGVGTNSTPHSVELTQQAAKIGVDAVLLVRLSELLHPETYRQERWGIAGLDRPIHFFELDGDTIWGATAAMLVDLLARITTPGPA